jgi:phosphoribosylaminoimidazole-succinocarboxamide synthase
MTLIPQSVLDRQPPIEGLPLRGRGKVRDSYDLPGHPDKMFVLASPRISIFDHVLNAEIPGKGEILTATNYFLVRELVEGLFPHDLIACGARVNDFLPPHLQGRIDL